MLFFCIIITNTKKHNAPEPVRQYLKLALKGFDDFDKMTPPSLDVPLYVLVKSLIEERKSIPDRYNQFPSCDEFTRLDNILIPLLQVQREMDYFGPMNMPSTYVSPLCYDVMLTDMRPEDLPERISTFLHVKYLSLAKSPIWPLEGIVYGPNRRMLLSVPVSLYDTSVYVHFIFDTGAPTTYIAQSVLDRFKIQEWDMLEKPIKINGIRTPLCVSDTTKLYVGDNKFIDCHFKGMNILGMDYVEGINATLHVDFGQKKLILNKQEV